MSRAAVPALAAALVLVVTPSAAAADGICGWHVGGELRAELGMHPLRFGGGVLLGDVELTAIVDPLALIDGAHDLDLLVGFPLGQRGWRLITGARATTITLAEGLHWQDKLVVGATAPLPAPGRHLRALAGFEASIQMIRHGGGGATTWFPLDSWESYDLGIFLRLEYARP